MIFIVFGFNEFVEDPILFVKKKFKALIETKYRLFVGPPVRQIIGYLNYFHYFLFSSLGDHVQLG